MNSSNIFEEVGMKSTLDLVQATADVREDLTDQDKARLWVGIKRRSYEDDVLALLKSRSSVNNGDTVVFNTAIGTLIATHMKYGWRKQWVEPRCVVDLDKLIHAVDNPLPVTNIADTKD